MYSHLTRSQTHSWIGFKRYRLTAKIHATPEERQIIDRHGLMRIEVFHDPLRDDLSTHAMAAHDKAKARGLFVTKARDATSICGSEIRALVATARSLLAFNVTVADLCRGITITHKSLQAIGEIERILTECIDAIDRHVRAARGYAEATEDIFAPGTEDDGAVPPTEWARTWRH